VRWLGPGFRAVAGPELSWGGSDGGFLRWLGPRLPAEVSFFDDPGSSGLCRVHERRPDQQKDSGSSEVLGLGQGERRRFRQADVAFAESARDDPLGHWEPIDYVCRF
jgi:hypothetical protein